VSAEAYLAIRCDHRDPADEQCMTEWQHPVWAPTHTELRRYLKKHGWRRTRDGRDLCPDHAGPTPT
jgi:hypothetical protein